MSFWTMLTTMADGMLKTILLFALTLIGSIPIGMVVVFLKKSKFKPVAWLTEAYIAVMRGTPLMLQLLVWYFGPYYLFGFSTRGFKFPALLIGFILNYAAYFAEIYRSGIDSMPIGQYEAAEILGYSKFATFMRIILPQVIKRVLPAVTNEVITLVKDTSLASALAYSEVFSLAKQISASQTSFLPFVIAGVFYFVANYVVAWIMKRIEKSMQYYN
ncbi:MAG: amino acid ABC transporter permease [Lachnospiraceae bacterium]|nr:amino acid ABC transporter permease [Lachnospiraceae bacterium]